jgi:hypothetical protein
MEQARQFFLSKGLSQDQVAGILANISAESGFNPNLSGDNGTSYGLFQHHADRLAAMRAQYGANPTAQQQLEFAWQELQTSHEMTLLRLQQQRTASGAAYEFAGSFEVPQNTGQRANERAAAAPQFLPGPRAAAGSTGAPSPVSAVPDPALRPTAAVPARVGTSALAGASNSTSTTDVRIGNINVVTQATDPNGIAKGIGASLNDELIAQSNRGLQ